MNATNQMQQNQMNGMPANMGQMGMNMQQMQGPNQQMPNQMFNNQAMMSMMPNNGQQRGFPQQQMINNQMAMNQGFPQPTPKQREELNQKYKTERCRHYETHKNCLLKEKCHFAHGDEELRKPGDQFTPEQLILAQKSIQYQNCNQTPGKPQGQYQQNQRGRPSKPMGGNYGQNNGSFRGRGGMNNGRGRGNFQNNNFRGGGQNQGGQYGNNGMNQNRMSQNYNQQPQNMGQGSPKQEQQQQQQQPGQISSPTPGPNYKTVKCRHFEKRGYCKFGDKCSYAHGDQELRTSQGTPTGQKMRPSGGMNNQMPAPMGIMQTPEGQQFSMMMQNQMGFPGQGMYNIDPNMNMQMMFHQGSGNDPQNQQFGMIPNQQFMQMQSQLMGMQLQQQQQAQYPMQPTVINFKNFEKLPDGTQQQVNNTLSINPMEQTIEANKSINEVCTLINNGDNDQAFMILSKLKDQGKIQFQINKNQMQNQVENAEQQITQAK